MTPVVMSCRCLLLTTLMFVPSSSYIEPEVMLDLHRGSTINVTNSCRDDNSCVESFTQAECLFFGICHFRCPSGSRTNFPAVLGFNSTTCEDDLVDGLPVAANQTNVRYYVNGTMDSPCSISGTVQPDSLALRFTVSFWVQGFCNSTCTLISLGANEVILKEGSSLVINNGSMSTLPYIDVATVDWTHVIITQRSEGIVLYIDNARQEGYIDLRAPTGDVTDTLLVIGTTEALNIESDFYRLVDVRIFEDSLTDREIEAVYTGTLPPVSDVPECRCPASHQAVDRGINCTDGTSTIPRLELEYNDAGAILDGDASTSWASLNMSNVDIVIDLGNSFQVTEVNLTINERGAIPDSIVWTLSSESGNLSTLHTCQDSGCVLNSPLTDTNYRDSMIRYVVISLSNSSPYSLYIESIEIAGRCDCGGVASRCIKVPGSPDYRCECEHNTEGPHCEDCQVPYYRFDASDLRCLYCTCIQNRKRI